MDKGDSELEGKERKVYSNREKLLLMSLVDKFKNIIENKKTDATNLPKKNAAWKQITELYNANDVTRRTDKQLKKLWDNLKQRTRKNDSEFKKQLIQTGGGPPPKEDDDPMNEMVRQIVPTISYTLENPWDSTSLIMKRNTEKTVVEEEKVLKGEIIVEELLPYESEENIQENKDILPEGLRKHKLSTPVGLKRKRKNSSSPYQRVSLIEQEAALRIEKLKISIEQQQELHLVRIKAAEAETNYWKKKTELLNKFKD